MTVKSKLMAVVWMILLLKLVSAASFLTVSTNQQTYANGDLLIINIRLDDPNLVVTMDASVLDPFFRNDDVRHSFSTVNLTHTFIYPLSFLSTMPDGTYPVLFNAYNPVTKTSDALTYNIIKRKPTIIGQDIQQGSIIIRVKPAATTPPPIEVPTGQVKVCFPDGKCITRNQDWFTFADNPENDPIASMSKRLNDINTRLGSIDSTQATNVNNIKTYIDTNNQQLTVVVDKLDASVNKYGTIMTNQTEQTQQALKVSTITSISSIVAMFIFTLLIMYVLYLRYGTSWYYW
jgi:hypothetical protein